MREFIGNFSNLHWIRPFILVYFLAAVASNAPLRADEPYLVVCRNAQFEGDSQGAFYSLPLAYVDAKNQIWTLQGQRGNLNVLCRPRCRDRFPSVLYRGVLGMAEKNTSGPVIWWQREGEYLVRYEKGFTETRRLEVYKPNSLSRDWQSCKTDQEVERDMESRPTTPIRCTDPAICVF